MLARIKYYLLGIDEANGQEIVDKFVLSKRGGRRDVVGQYNDALDDRKDDLYGSFSLRRAVVIDQASVTSCLLCSVCSAVSLCRKKNFNQLNMSLRNCDTLVFCSKICIHGTEDIVPKMPRTQILNVRSLLQSLGACGTRTCPPAERSVKSKTKCVNARRIT
jgi:hypothetical protein